MSTPRIHLPDENIKGGNYCTVTPLFVPIMGAPGSTGLSGPTGIQGQTGLYIQVGIQGVTGLAGQVGITGLQGPLGDTGNTGIRGLTGVRGNTVLQGGGGDTGIRGNTGIRGLTGMIGGTGILGQTGIQGDRGIQGLQGNTGIVGIGQTGVAGMTGVGTSVTAGTPKYLLQTTTPTTIGDSNLFHDGTGTVGINLNDTTTTVDGLLWDSTAALIVRSEKSGGTIVETYDNDPNFNFNDALGFRQSAFDHSCSAYLNHDVYANMGAVAPGTYRRGGLKINTFTLDSNYSSLQVNAITNPVWTFGVPVISFNAMAQSGTGAGTVDNTQVIFAVSNAGYDKFNVRGDGTVNLGAYANGYLTVNGSGDVIIASGASGAVGATGIQGLTGDTGIQGNQGDIGSTGVQGIQGLIGNTGIQGLKGDTGIGTSVSGSQYTFARFGSGGTSLTDSSLYNGPGSETLSWYSANADTVFQVGTGDIAKSSAVSAVGYNGSPVVSILAYSSSFDGTSAGLPLNYMGRLMSGSYGPLLIDTTNWNNPIYFATRNVVRMAMDTSCSIYGVPVYGDNTAATSAGLTVGAIYRNGANPDLLCIVH